MLTEQAIVTLCRGLLYPAGGGLRWIHANVCLRVVEVGVVVGAVVGVGGDEQHHLVGASDRYLTVAVGHRSALRHRLHAHDILHAVVVEPCRPAERVGAVGRHLARGHGVGHVAEPEVLLAASRRREANGHDVGRIRHEKLPLIVHAVLAEAHLGEGGVERELATVMRHAHGAEPRLDAELSRRGEAAEAERVFRRRLVRHHAVEVFPREPCRLLPVASRERLANLRHDGSRLLVHVPIVGRPARRVGATAPQRLLVERYALSLHRAEHVAAYAAVAYGQRARLPFGVGVDRRVAGALHLSLRGVAVSARGEPHGVAPQRCRGVEPISQWRGAFGHGIGECQGTQGHSRKQLSFLSHLCLVFS